RIATQPAQHAVIGLEFTLSAFCLVAAMRALRIYQRRERVGLGDEGRLAGRIRKEGAQQQRGEHGSRHRHGPPPRVGKILILLLLRLLILFLILLLLLLFLPKSGRRLRFLVGSTPSSGLASPIPTAMLKARARGITDFPEESCPASRNARMRAGQCS